MVHAARASVNRATARFILRSGSAASKGSSTVPSSPNQSLVFVFIFRELPLHDYPPKFLIDTAGD